MTSHISLDATPLNLLLDREEWLKRSIACNTEELKRVRAAISIRKFAQKAAARELKR